jgi:hypothetical protein
MMVTISTTRHHGPANPNIASTRLVWAVASAMVISVAAIVIAVIALTGRSTSAGPAPAPSYHYTGTIDTQCMPTHVVHPC